MNSEKLSKFSNDDLIKNTKLAVSTERKAITDVLHHLHEIEVRRLHLLRGFSSLWEFATVELGYTGGGADRRIKAMRLMFSVPGTEQLITDGSLSLTNASQLQNFFKAERKENGKIYTVEQKRELIKTVQHQSTRECEKILAQLSPELERKDKELIISRDEIEIRFTAHQVLLDKLKKIKGLIAHKKSNPSYGELFEMLADIAIEKLDPAKKQIKQTISAKVQSEMPSQKLNSTPAQARSLKTQCITQEITRSRYISVAIRQSVWKRDSGRCTYVDPISKRRCMSAYKLQIDHAIPYAFGGASELINLRLLCIHHNQLSAVQVFGKKKMAPFLRVG